MVPRAAQIIRQLHEGLYDTNPEYQKQKEQYHSNNAKAVPKTRRWPWHPKDTTPKGMEMVRSEAKSEGGCTVCSGRAERGFLWHFGYRTPGGYGPVKWMNGVFCSPKCFNSYHATTPQ